MRTVDKPTNVYGPEKSNTNTSKYCEQISSVSYLICIQLTKIENRCFKAQFSEI